MDSIFPYKETFNSLEIQNSTTFGPSSAYAHYLGDLSLLLGSHHSQKWIYSLFACLLVGLSGVFPLLLFSKTQNTRDHDSGNFKLGPERLKYLLSFAVGSLLGDVFLHLLPEAWSTAIVDGFSGAEALKYLGKYILAGITSCLVCEIIASSQAGKTEPEPDQVNGSVVDTVFLSQNLKEQTSQMKLAGYLNLVANGFDNFTHGLAVAGSFIISPKIGVLTTIAILFHEIPHEIGDFAILLRSGFDPWSAAKAQLSTATVGLVGAIFTLSVDCMKTIENYTSWILPFTAGCFIHIALSNLLPDLLKEENQKESMKQFFWLILGIGAMGSFALISEV